MARRRAVCLRRCQRAARHQAHRYQTKIDTVDRHTQGPLASICRDVALQGFKAPERSLGRYKNQLFGDKAGMRCPSASSEALGDHRIAKGAPWIMITDEGHGYINRGGRLPGHRRPLQKDEPPGNVFLLANR